MIGSMPNRLLERLAALNWNSIQQTLDEQGYAPIPALLDKDQCRAIMDTYEEEAHFRNTIDMARYRFGIGTYKYYQAPCLTCCSCFEKGYTRN